VGGLRLGGPAGSYTREQKQLAMVAYAAELFYDLMIPARHNTSESPGFETAIGIYGGGD